MPEVIGVVPTVIPEVGVGMFKTSATNVATPLPVVVSVMGFCLPLKVLQSDELKAPLLVALAVGKLNVCVSVAELIAKSVPDVPTAKYCVCLVYPLIEETPLEKVVIT